MYNYTERYDEVDLENLPKRERRETMIIEDPEKGLLTSLENMPMLKTSSVGAQNQKKEGTCYAYVAARLITRLITQKFPDDFEVNDEEFGLLWDGKNGEFEDNCYLDKSINLNKVRDMLTINKCSITKRYNQMLLFCYTLFTIKIKFGCNGFNLEETLLHFEKNIRKFYDVNVFSPELDTFAFEKFIRPLIIFNYPKKNFEVKSVFYNLNNNSPQRNWILNFPEPAKRALENKMYVSFRFSMPENQWKTISVNNIYDSDPIIRDTSCIYPITSHVVTITKWEQEEPGMPAYVTMINSWGANWGEGGFIRISSENYYKFLMTPFCEKDFDFNGNMVDPENMETTEKMIEPANVGYRGMQFTYFKVANDKPFVTYKTEPALLRSTLDTRVPNPLGGKSKKSKKRKSIKRKSIKRKSIKRKSIKRKSIKRKTRKRY